MALIMALIMDSMITPITPPFNAAVRNAAKEFRPGYIAAITSFTFIAILRNKIITSLIADNYGGKHMGKHQVLAAYLNTNGSALYTLPWKRSFMVLAEANQSCENLISLLEETIQANEEADNSSQNIYSQQELNTFQQFKDFLSYVAHHARQTTGYIQDMQEICGKDMDDTDYQMQRDACLFGDAKDASMRFIPLNTLKLGHYFLPIIETVLAQTKLDDSKSQKELETIVKSVKKFREARPDSHSFDNETYADQEKALTELSDIQKFFEQTAIKLNQIEYKRHGTILAIESMAAFCGSYIIQNNPDPNGNTVVQLSNRNRRLQHNS
ncbi:MAG: hypothetical protein CMH32_00970 [Micavibrio sp.]|nr:hypothetical protein [Micavibrio sp.]HCK32395.1 hypothetical protein [Rhodospirillaceae bacterium]